MKKLICLSLLLALIVVQANADNWMSKLPDNMYVSMVSIPGAHDSATGEGFPTNGNTLSILNKMGSTYAQTQDIGVSAQWALGVRAFDFRPMVNDDELNINHGVVQTNLDVDEAFQILTDSLKANPTEFAILHLLYADDFDEDSSSYVPLLTAIFDQYSDYLVQFRRDLTVADMRGKILVLSRDKYADTPPYGGFMADWVGWISWTNQSAGTVYGSGTNDMASSPLYMQDLSDTTDDGAIDEKVEGVQTMLDYTTNKVVNYKTNIVWVFNFASAYSQETTLLSYTLSTSEGYRENASYTNAAIIEYLKENQPGPTGIVMSDYVGVDESDDYATRGQELLDTLIANNFKYLERLISEYSENIDSLATICSEIIQNTTADTEASDALQTAIATAQSELATVIDAATSDNYGETIDQLLDIYNTLENARQTYILVAQPADDYPLDFTYLMDNSSFERGDLTSWTYGSGSGDTKVYENFHPTYTLSNAHGQYIYNTWGESSMYVTQTVTGLPTGYYTVAVLAASDQGNSVTLTANDQTETAAMTSDKSTGQDITIQNIKIVDGTLTLKASSDSWFKADYFRINLTATVQLDDLAQTLEELLAQAQQIIDDDTITTSAIEQQLSSAIQEYSDIEYSTSTYSTAVSVLSNLINTAEQSTPFIANADSLIQVCENYRDHSVETTTDANDNLDQAITKAKENVQLATSVSELQELITELEQARQTYTLNAYPIDNITFDMTFLITNADLSSTDGWTTSNVNGSATSSGGTVLEFYAGYGSLNVTEASISQSITLPGGDYKLTGYGFFRYGQTYDVATTTSTGYMTIADSTLTIPTLASASYTSYPDALTQAADAFYTDNNYATTINFQLPEESDVDLGYNCTFDAAYSWCAIGALHLYMTGGLDITDLKDSLAVLIAQAQQIIQSDTTTTGVDALLAQAIEEDSSLPDGQSAYKQAITTLETLIAAAEECAPYVANADSLIRVCENYRDHSVETTAGAFDTFAQAIQTAKDAVAAATCADDLTTLITNLETARQTYTLNAYPIDNVTFDMTYLLTNPDLSSTDGWTTSITTTDGSTMGSYSGIGYLWEFYSGYWGLYETAGSALQSVTLPAGAYQLNGYAFFRYGISYDTDSSISTGYLVAGDNTSAVATLGSIDTTSYANSMAEADAAFYTYGQYYNALDFTLDEESTIDVGYSVTFDYYQSWFIFGSIYLYKTGPASETTYVETALAALQEAIDTVQTLDLTTNVGTDVFLIPQALADSVTTALQAAQETLSSTDLSTILAATQTLLEAIQAFQDPQLNTPADGQRIRITNVTDGFDYQNNALTFLYDDTKTDDGLYNLSWAYPTSEDYAQAYTFIPTGTKNQYYIAFADADEITRYVCTQAGAAYLDGTTVSTRTDRIRVTTDSACALAINIALTSESSVWNLTNTEADALIGSNGDTGFYTSDAYAQLTLTTAEPALDTLTLTSASDYYATLILPYNAQIPTGLEVFELTSTGETSANGVTTLLYDTVSTIAAHTPYVIHAHDNQQFTHTFQGYGLAVQDQYCGSYMTGTYVSMTAETGTYVLQKHTDYGLAFYIVDDVQPTVGANRAYITAGLIDTESETNVRVALLTQQETTTVESNTQTNLPPATVDVYSLSGVRLRSGVSTSEALQGLKSGIYIVGKEKVIVP